MPIHLAPADTLSSNPPIPAQDDERWRMFVRTTLLGAPGESPSPVEAFRRIFEPASL